MRLRSSGFTLIELMVSIAVLAVLMALAVPSFVDFRQRAALRGASDQLVSIWGDARFEALKRNRLVKVVIKGNGSGGLCVGVAEATSAADDTECDCLTLACGIANYPTNQNDWRGVTMVGSPTLGNTSTAVAVIDPKRGILAQAADAGGVSLKGPAGSKDYRLNVEVDRNGRAVVCEPAEASHKLPQYTDRRCPSAIAPAPAT